MMTQKFPIWLYIVLAVQFLLALAAAAFLMIIGSAFSGTFNFDLISITVLALLLLPVPFCFWLAKRQWATGQYNRAKLLALGPILFIFLSNLVLSLIMS